MQYDNDDPRNIFTTGAANLKRSRQKRKSNPPTAEATRKARIPTISAG